jgi:sec-independent protein translocase protein TatA
MSMVLGFIGIGTPEMLLIVFVTLLLFGGKKLPELARGLGRGIREFKDASETIKRDITEQINHIERDVDLKNVMVEDVESAINDAKKSLEETTETTENTHKKKEIQAPNADQTPVHPILKAGAPIGTFTHQPGREPDYVGSSGVYYNNPDEVQPTEHPTNTSSDAKEDGRNSTEHTTSEDK